MSILWCKTRGSITTEHVPGVAASLDTVPEARISERWGTEPRVIAGLAAASGVAAALGTAPVA